MSNTRWPRASHIIFLTLIAADVLGCARIRSSRDENSPLTLDTSSSKTVIRPGEALIIDTALTQDLRKRLELPQLNRASLTFVLWNAKDGSPRNIRPISSPRENPGEAVRLKEGIAHSRPFLFTKFLSDPGIYFFQAIYRTPESRGTPALMAVSKPLEIIVEGKPLFARGKDGLIVRDEAIRIANEHSGNHADKASAELLHDELGFYVWHVRLENLSGDQGRETKAFFVNPYRGSVNAEAKTVFEGGRNG